MAMEKSSEIGGERDGRIKLYRDLVKGDLVSVIKYLDRDRDAIYAKISTIGETPIHIAVLHGHQDLAMELLRKMREYLISSSCAEKLSEKDDYGDTPLHIAARGANKAIANALVHQSPSLLPLGDADGQLPLTLAAVFGNWDMLNSLNRHGLGIAIHHNSQDHDPKWIIFTEFIKSKNFGMRVLYSSLKRDMNALDAFSTRSKSFRVLRFLKGLLLSVLKAIGIGEILNTRVKKMEAHELLSKMCSPIWTFDSKHVGVYFEAIKRAIKCGNAEFVEEVLRSNPALIWGNKESGSIFHIALAFRQEKIWNLIYGLTTEQRNKIIGTLVKSNNMLHIAAYPLVTDEATKKEEEQRLWKIFSKAPGAFMKVQRELQWYKEVERMVPSSFKILANKNGETPPELLSKWHSELVKDGEKWTREIASSCTIVAALIVTVMFAAAFTLPGGVKEDSGNPHFLQRNSFMVFIISDALSLFSSVTAVLMFLNIVTSRFEEEDFLKALPKRLVTGHLALLLSIVSMMIAFSATLVIVLGERTLVIVLGKRIRWSVILVTWASVPVILFYLLQIPLFVDMVSYSTYGRGIFNRKTKCCFFNNPNDYVPPKHKYSSLV